MNCPKCHEDKVYEDIYGLACFCGWRPTVTACTRCKCLIGDCTGHRAGGTGARVLPCVACSRVASEEVTA